LQNDSAFAATPAPVAQGTPASDLFAPA